MTPEGQQRRVEAWERRAAAVDAHAKALLDAWPRTSRILLVGPPGAGKVMTALRLHALLDAQHPLNDAGRMDVAMIYGACRLEPASLGRPRRAPHHTVSTVGLVGGGLPARPGDVTLAHHGVLLLDELLEFRRETIDALGMALRHGRVWRDAGRAPFDFPADPALVVATATPCACGPAPRGCACRPDSALAYQARLAQFAHLMGLTRIDVERDWPEEPCDT